MENETKFGTDGAGYDSSPKIELIPSGNKASTSEREVDITDIWKWMMEHKTAVFFTLLGLILIGAFVSRTIGVANFQGKYLISPDDPYYFYRTTELVAAEGKLPVHDDLRYYPDGVEYDFDNQGTSYFAGYALRIARMVNPNLTAFDIAGFYGPTLLVIGLVGYFLVSSELFDRRTALISTGFIAFSIAIFFRTTAGFLEKEPLFVPMFTFAMYFFVKAYKQKDWKWLAPLAILSGVFTGLAGFASGLVQFIMIFVSMFAIAEIIIDKMNLKKFGIISMWFITYAVVLTNLTAKYGSFLSLNFLTSGLSVFSLIAIFLSGFNVIFQKITAKSDITFLKKLEKIMPAGFWSIVFGGILLFAIAIIIMPGYTLTFMGSLVDKVQTPGGTSRMALSVSENQPPAFLESWLQNFAVVIPTFFFGNITFGVFFFLFFAGCLIIFHDDFKHFKYAKVLTLLFALFMCALIFENFSYDPKWNWMEIIFGNQFLYFGAFLVIGGAIVVYNYIIGTDFKKINSINLFVLVWFLISTIAANGAIRLFFMLAFPLMMIAGYFVVWLSDWLKKKYDNWSIWIPYAFAAVIILISFYMLTMSSANTGGPFDEWYKAMYWIKDNTKTSDVLTHWWDYGYLVQSIGQRATVGDPGNYMPERNYDIGGYVFNAKNNSEVLKFLDKYDDPNYFLICSEDVFKFYQIANLGSLSQLYGPLAEGKTLGKETYYSTYIIKSQESVQPNNLGNAKEYPYKVTMDYSQNPSQLMTEFKHGSTLYGERSSYILSYVFPAKQNGTYGSPLVQIFDSVTGRTEMLTPRCKCEVGVGCIDNGKNDSAPVCYLEYQGGLLNIPYKTKDILFTNLYLLDVKIPGFEQVYEGTYPLSLQTIHGQGMNVKIYKYDYSALESNPDDTYGLKEVETAVKSTSNTTKK